MFAVLLVAAACGGEMPQDDPDSGTEVDPPALHVESPQLEAVNTGYPVAVGATVEIRGVQDREIVDVEAENEDIFAVDSVGDNLVTVRALAEGESSFRVDFRLDGDRIWTDSFALRAIEPAEAWLGATCWMLDAGEIIVEDPDDPGLAYDKVWLTDHTYDADYDLVDDSGEMLYGEYTPYEIEPDGGVVFGERWEDSIEIETGEDEVEVDIEPMMEESSGMSMTLADEDRAELAVVRLEDPDEDPHWSFTYPGEEPTLDLEENESYPFLPHRMIDDRAVCEPEMGPEYRITSKTPDVCLLREFITLSDEDDEPVETIETNDLGELQLESEGECTVEMEYLENSDGGELRDEWTWTVE